MQIERTQVNRRPLRSVVAAAMGLTLAVPTGLAGRAVPASAAQAAVSQAAAAQAADATTALPGARVAIVVDESGSLTGAGVDQERAAASSIAIIDPSPDTQAAVIGFGSSNGADQSAAHAYCSLTPTRAAEDRTRLQACAEQIHARTPAEGYETDFVAALAAGISEVQGGPDGTPRVIFLLTDGLLNVPNSPQFGPVGGSARTAEAQRQLEEQVLPEARSKGIQVWPLGFGEANLAAMELIAAGGFGVNPACPTAGAPQASLATVDTVARLALAAFAAARCAGLASGATPDVPAGGTSEIFLPIPAIATDGSIVVNKPHPDIAVSYLDPDKQPVPRDGTKDGSIFSASGSGRSIESLRITNPKAGTWTVRLAAPPDIPAGAVTATAIFTGAVHASILMSPPEPVAGATVTVQVRVLTRRGAVLRTSDLAGLKASLTIAGKGFDPFPVTLLDDGRQPDAVAGDGTFAATFPMPPQAKPGGATAVATVDAPGLTSDARPYNFVVPLDAGKTPVAELSVSPSKTLHRGQALLASASISNPGPSAATVSFALEDESDGLIATVEPASQSVSPGTTPSRISLTIPIDAGTRPGPIAFKLVARTGDRVIGGVFVTAHVSMRPGFVKAHLPYLVVGVLLLVLAGIGLDLYVRSRRLPPVNTLHAKLIDGEGKLIGATVQGGNRTDLRVKIVGLEGSGIPHLEASNDSDSIRISWTKGGQLRYESSVGHAEVSLGTWVTFGSRPEIVTVETNSGDPGASARPIVQIGRAGPAPSEDAADVAPDGQVPEHERSEHVPNMDTAEPGGGESPPLAGDDPFSDMYSD